MTDTVELTFPVQADLVVLARITASTIAVRAGFDVEEIEDLRLAVDELCISLTHERGAGTLELRFSRSDDQVDVSCTYRADSGGVPIPPPTPTVEGLSELIIDALVDEHGHSMDGGDPYAWLRKRRTRQPT